MKDVFEDKGYIRALLMILCAISFAFLISSEMAARFEAAGFLSYLYILLAGILIYVVFECIIALIHIFTGSKKDIDVFKNIFRFVFILVNIALYGFLKITVAFLPFALFTMLFFCLCYAAGVIVCYFLIKDYSKKFTLIYFGLTFVALSVCLLLGGVV